MKKESKIIFSASILTVLAAAIGTAYFVRKKEKPEKTDSDAEPKEETEQRPKLTGRERPRGARGRFVKATEQS